MEKVKKTRFVELDVLRGIAAIMVVLFHLTMNNRYGSLFKYGVTGVELFFIISGFVIPYSVKNKTVTQFLKGRFWRLYPTYWVAIIFTSFFIVLLKYKGLIVAPNVASFTWEKFAYNLTMIQKVFSVQNIDGPYWTLYVELLFYALVAILMKCSKLKLLIPISAVLIVATMVFDFFGCNMTSLYHYFPLVCHLPLFFAGMLFYEIYKGGVTLFKYAGLIFAYMSSLYFFSLAGTSRTYIDFLPFAGILLGYFILFLYLTQREENFLFNSSLQKVAVFIGSISYPMYLIHQFVGIYVVLPRLAFLPLPVALFVTLLIFIVIAYLIYRFLERPLIRLVKR